MAHDKQYKDSTEDPNVLVDRFDYPREDEWYWNRYTHRVEQAKRSILDEKYLIVKRGN